MSDSLAPDSLGGTLTLGVGASSKLTARPRREVSLAAGVTTCWVCARRSSMGLLSVADCTLSLANFLRRGVSVQLFLLVLASAAGARGVDDIRGSKCLLPVQACRGRDPYYSYIT